jgi:hypothetical protein
METTSNGYVVAQHLAYLALSLGVTWAVGRTLKSNGAIFLRDTFKGRDGLADAVNHLLVVGFYLINCGWVVRGVKSGDGATTVQGIIERVGEQLGGVLLVLGAMHFLNLYAFYLVRGKNERRSSSPVAQQVVSEG